MTVHATVCSTTIIRTVDGRCRANFLANSHLKLITPTTVKRTVAPRRRPNKDLRTREHLTEAEVDRLLAVAKARGSVQGLLEQNAGHFCLQQEFDTTSASVLQLFTVQDTWA